MEDLFMSNPPIDRSNSAGASYPIQPGNNDADHSSTPLIAHALNEDGVAIPILTTLPSPTAALPQMNVSIESATEQEEEVDFSSEGASSVADAADVKEATADVKETTATQVGLEQLDALKRDAAKHINLLFIHNDNLTERTLSHDDHLQDITGVETIMREVNEHLAGGVAVLTKIDVERGKKIFFARQPLADDIIRKIQAKEWMHNGRRLDVEFITGDAAFEQIYHQLMNYFQRYIDYHTNAVSSKSGSQAIETQEEQREKDLEKKVETGRAEDRKRDLKMTNEVTEKHKQPIDNSRVEKRLKNEKNNEVKKERQSFQKLISKIKKEYKSFFEHRERKIESRDMGQLRRRKSDIIKKDQISKDEEKAA